MFRFRFVLVPVLASLFLTGAACLTSAEDVLRLGVFTDTHVHDTESPNEGKIMSNYAERLTAFVNAMNQWPADAVLQLGDFVNGAFVMGADLGDPTRIPALLDHGVELVSGFAGPVHHVIGNHDVYDLTKEQFLAATGLEHTWYSFDLGGFHFVVLDAQFNRDGESYGKIGWMVQGTIPQAELDWLAEDLAATEHPTIILIHQPLDSDFSLTAGGPPISNHLEVRDLLVASGRVIAVFQGHTHHASHREIDGIHYVTFEAMVDHTEPTPPSWGAVTLDNAARTLLIEGAGNQPDLSLSF